MQRSVAASVMITVTLLLISFELWLEDVANKTKRVTITRQGKSVSSSFPENSQSFFGNEGIVHDDGVLPSSTNLTIKDITFTITTSHTLVERWDNVLLTWYPQASESVVWITDKGSKVLQQRSGAKWIETNCLSDHSLPALACKLGVEFEEYIVRRRTKWWCHVDDDMYVNTDVLVRLLSKYDSDYDVYLGRNSIDYPVEYTWENSHVSAWFGTGGGYCISFGLAMKMDRFVSEGQLVKLSLKLRVPDDVTIGFIVNFLLRTKLTTTKLISTHLEMHGLNYLKASQIPLQAMLSYGYRDGVRVNITAADVLNKSKFFSIDEDPSRFFTIHCMIHPQTDFCRET